jgi:AcrR family transcriptional regulator
VSPRRGYDRPIPERAPTRPRQRRKPIEVRRREVLDAALQLVVTGGFAAVTMEAIARRAALAKTVVYNAYPNRTELLAALLQRESERALSTFADALASSADDGAPAPTGPAGVVPPASSAPSAGDPLEGPLRWVEAIAVAIQRDPTTWRLILLPPDEPPEALKAAVGAGREVVLDHVRVMLADLAASRPAISRLDRDFLPLALLAICEAGATQLIAAPDAYDPARVVAFARDLLEALSR